MLLKIEKKLKTSPYCSLAQREKRPAALLCAAAWAYSPKTEDRAAESAQRAAAPGLKTARQPPAADPGRRIGSDGSPLISPGQNPAPAASPWKTLDHLPPSRFSLSCPAAPPAAPRRRTARSSRRAMAMPWLRASLVHLFLSPFPFSLPVRAGAAVPLHHSRWPPGHHGRRARTRPLLGAPL